MKFSVIVHNAWMQPKSQSWRPDDGHLGNAGQDWTEGGGEPAHEPRFLAPGPALSRRMEMQPGEPEEHCLVLTDLGLGTVESAGV